MGKFSKGLDLFKKLLPEREVSLHSHCIYLHWHDSNVDSFFQGHSLNCEFVYVCLCMCVFYFVVFLFFKNVSLLLKLL